LAERGETPYCKNCGAPLAGAYCSDCSQRADVHLPSTLELIHEALEGITHSDSRLWVSLKYLLFVPGKLTQEFAAGRRVAYLPPFRLYLVLSVLFFVLTSHSQPHIGPLSPDPLAAGSPAGVKITADEACSHLQVQLFGGHQGEQRLRQACKQAVSDHGQNLQHIVISAIPKAMFIFLPLIAFFHMLLYWRPRHLYAEHLLFFVHLHAFLFLAMTLIAVLSLAGDLLPALDSGTRVLAASVGIYIPVHVLLAMRRVFKRGRLNTLFKAFCLFLIYVTMLAMTMAGVFIYALWQL
jgi:hypothetical protein